MKNFSPLPLYAALVCAASGAGAGVLEGSPDGRPRPEGAQNAPILVGGTDQLILLEPPVLKNKAAEGKKRLPMFVVVLLWVIAMVLWQVYFNRKRP